MARTRAGLQPSCSQEQHEEDCRHFGKYGNYLGSHDKDCTGAYCICRKREQNRVIDEVAREVATACGAPRMEEQHRTIARAAIAALQRKGRLRDWE